MKKEICGKEISEIRKAYFDGKISVLCADILGKGEADDNDVKDLADALQSFKNEEERFKRSLNEKVGDNIFPDAAIMPPSVDELMEGVNDTLWREPANKSIQKVEALISSARTIEGEFMKMSDGTNRKIKPSFWLDAANQVLAESSYMDRNRIYWDQMFRREMTRIIDEFQVSRKEAEERARLTKAYAEYKYATLLYDRVQEFIMLMKKKDAEFNPQRY